MEVAAQFGRAVWHVRCSLLYSSATCIRCPPGISVRMGCCPASEPGAGGRGWRCGSFPALPWAGDDVGQGVIRRGRT